MEWWRDEAGHTLMRDYFRVESREGLRVWLFRRMAEDREDPNRLVRRRAGSCTACSHEQCRRVSEQGARRAERTSLFPSTRTVARLMRSLPSPRISRSCAVRRIPKEFILQAAALGLTGIGIADRNSVAGVVRAYQRARGMERAHRETRRRKAIDAADSEARRRRAARASPTARPTSSPIRRTAPPGAA